MTTATTASQPDARAETLVGAYERAGYRRIAPPILQPAEPFLDLSGEDIRNHVSYSKDQVLMSGAGGRTFASVKY